MFSKAVLIFGLVFWWATLPMAYAQEQPLGLLFKDRQPIKVYIGEISNASDQDQVSADVFKQSLEDSLLNRKLLKFEITDNPGESDIQISAVIKHYQYSERGKVKPIPGVSIIFDAASAMTTNYAEIEAEYTVTDTQSGETLWQKDLDDSLKKAMTPDESIPLICDKISRTFVWRCFGKKQDLEK